KQSDFFHSALKNRKQIVLSQLSDKLIAAVRHFSATQCRRGKLTELAVFITAHDYESALLSA
ncbi:MAG: hypothetical protein RSE53_08315, partial [Oscillospiraceae bacterium]